MHLLHFPMAADMNRSVSCGGASTYLPIRFRAQWRTPSILIDTGRVPATARQLVTRDDALLAGVCLKGVNGILGIKLWVNVVHGSYAGEDSGWAGDYGDLRWELRVGRVVVRIDEGLCYGCLTECNDPAVRYRYTRVGHSAMLSVLTGSRWFSTVRCQLSL